MRLKELDTIRGIAILMVLFAHYVGWAGIIGTGGVVLFFVLSGYLIGGILVTNRDSKSYFKAFYARRFFRIFPAYYLFLLVIFFFPRTSLIPFWSYPFYLQNFFMGINDTFGVDYTGITWSLAIEEQFYIIFPFIIWAVQPKRLTQFLLFLLVISIVSRSRMFLGGFKNLVLLVPMMDSLILGILLFLWEKRLSILPLVFILIGSLVFRLMNISTLNHTFVSLFYFAFIGLFIKLKISNKLLGWIGLISYGLYLWHELFLYIFKTPIFAFPLVVLFCWLSYKYFEKPLLKLGHRFIYEN